MKVQYYKSESDVLVQAGKKHTWFEKIILLATTLGIWFAVFVAIMHVGV